MFQQSSFQGGNAFGSGVNATNTNRYQPAGFVQSHYQGQLTRSAASGPVTAHSGYQAGGSQGFAGTSNFASGGFGAQQSGFGAQGGNVGAVTQQNPVYRATNARQQDGPVIQHTGYTAGVNQGFGSQSAGFGGTASASRGSQNFGGAASSFGQGGVVGAMTQQNPVYRATNAREQDGPVIQHLGYTAATNQSFGSQPFGGQSFGTQSFGTQSFGSQNFGSQNAGSQGFANQSFANPGSSFGTSSFGQGGVVGAMTQQNPVYRATNAREQDGPVIQHLGYTSGTNQSFGAGAGTGNQNRYSF